MALRAQRIAASSVALDVLRSSSVLRTFFRSTNIHATIELPSCLHATGIRSNAIALPGHTTSVDFARARAAQFRQRNAAMTGGSVGCEPQTIRRDETMGRRRTVRGDAHGHGSDSRSGDRRPRRGSRSPRARRSRSAATGCCPAPTPHSASTASVVPRSPLPTSATSCSAIRSSSLSRTICAMPRAARPRQPSSHPIRRSLSCSAGPAPAPPLPPHRSFGSKALPISAMRVRHPRSPRRTANLPMTASPARSRAISTRARRMRSTSTRC